jgi:hypothetical protein
VQAIAAAAEKHKTVEPVAVTQEQVKKPAVDLAAIRAKYGSGGKR